MPRPKSFKPSPHGWTRGAFERALARHRQGHPAEAADTYRRILAVSPNDVDALHFFGLAEHQLGRSESGLESMDRALALRPSYADAHINRGNILKGLGRLDEAEASLKQALALRPDDANATNSLATVQRELGRLEEAADTLRRAIALSPDSADAHANLSVVLGKLGHLDEAMDAQERALRLRPRSASGYRHLGAILYARGRIDDAADVYRRWLAIEPGSAEAKHLYAGCTGGSMPDRAPDEVVRGLFDRMAGSFDRSLARLEYRAPALVAEAVHAAIGAPRGELDILDAGCGTGLCGPLLRPYAQRLVGVDLSARMIEQSSARELYDALAEAELTAFLGDNAGAFDLIVSADTLCYFGALEPVLASAAHALRARGQLFFTVERSDEREGLGYRLHPHGRYSHTEPYLRTTLRTAGLNAHRIDPVELRKEAGRWVPGWLVVSAET